MRETSPDITTSRAARGRPEDLVPAWLAALVLVLLLSVFGVAGYLVRGVLTSKDSRSAQQTTKVAVLERQVENDPEGDGDRLALGFAYQTSARYDDALEQYDLVLQDNPKDTAALYNKATVLMKTGERKKAEELYWDVLEIAPSHVLAAKSLGDYYAARGQYRSLLVAVRPAAEAEPSMADLQYLMGVGYEKLGKPTDAIPYYRQAIAHAPDMVKARDALSRLGALK